MSASVPPWTSGVRRLRRVLGGVAALAVQLALADPVPTSTTVLGPLTGPGALLHPSNVEPRRIAFYGTDLGFTYEHAGRLQFLFGDTSATESGDPIQASTGGRFDDGFGSIDLADWRDPAKITAGNIPPLLLGQNPGTTEMSAIDAGHALEGFKTPVGGFSNGRHEFGVFYTSKPEGCIADAACGGLACDTGLGYLGERADAQEGITVACVDGRPYCATDTMNDAAGKPVASSGFCTDRTSSVWRDDDIGRVSAVALKLRVGVRDSADPRRYRPLRDWLTNKFANLALRTVQDFVPARGTGRMNQDYRPAGETGANRRVLIWGRPGFIGVAARGRTQGLYLAYVDMPAGEDTAWKPSYYSGVDARGVAQWSAHERDAVALDLDSGKSGVQPQEVHDVVNQMSVAWAEPLGKWVMFYGGGMTRIPSPPLLPNCGVLEFFTGAMCRDVVTGDGAVRMRTADDPWGPWSAPSDVIAGGDPEARPIAGLYAKGGMLRHPECTAPSCAPHTADTEASPAEYGFLYAANIIEQWIRPAGKGVDILWNASTWDPYRVILLRTRLER